VVKDDEVLVRVHAAGVHICDWHLMTGLPYLMRIIGYGLRAPKARVRGIDVARKAEAVGKNVTQFQADDEVFGTCDGSFAEYDVPERTRSRPGRQTSPLSRRQLYPPPPSPPSRVLATKERFSQGGRS
jgi:NADPH:quinone reductase-like Zn-dependent oxidoreductase